jgi:hypothetical protein
MGKKQDDLKAIIQRLLSSNKTIGFTKTEIEKAIIKTKLIGDQRSIDNWFNLLWKLEYFTQPQPNYYCLNLVEISSLEIVLPDVKQERLDVSL